MVAPSLRVSPALAAGTQVGRYRVLGHLASGGMAAVYIAKLEGPSGFEKRIALKMIHGHLMEDSDFVKMFVDEARIAARLDHANIVHTFELVQTEFHLAIAMEYVPGLPLASLVTGAAGPAPVEPETAAWIGAEIAAGLHHAHTATDSDGQPLGIVHRDVSPRNLHIGFDGRPRLVDFGIARARGRLGHTTGGTVKGTFAYMAPEQFQAIDVDARADVWSLGVALWETLARKRLFRRDSEAETMHAVLNAEVPPLDHALADAPKGLVAAIARALCRDREGRWPTARAFEEELRTHVPARGEIVQQALVRRLGPLRDEHEKLLRKLIARDLPATEIVPILSPRTKASEEVTQVGEHEGVVATARDVGVSRSRRRVRVLAATLGAAVLAAVLAAVGATGGKGESREVRVSSAAPPAPVSAVPQDPPASAGTVRPQVSLRIETDAPGAWVRWDDAPPVSVPLELADLEPGSEHVALVGAPGHLERRVSVVAGAEPLINVSLRRAARRSTPHDKRRLAKNPWD